MLETAKPSDQGKASRNAPSPSVRRMVLIDRATMDHQLEGMLTACALLTGLLLVLLLWNAADRQWLSAWLGAYLLLTSSQFLRMFVRRGFAPKTTREAERSLRVRLLYNAAHGIAWACASVLFLDAKSSSGPWVLLSCLAVICIGGLMLSMISVWQYLAVLLPPMLTFQALLLRYGGGGLVIAIPIITALLIVLGRILNERMSRFLGSRYREAEQVGELKQRFSDLARDLEAKTRFVSVVSHDLRQPVHAMGLLAHGLDKHIADAQGRLLLSGIVSAIHSLQHSFDSLLDLTRLESNATRPRIARVSLQAVFARLESEFGPQARQNGTFLKLMPTQLVTYSDANLLHSVLGNFISNALSHCPESRVVVGCKRAGEHIDLLVLDTGAGIPEDKLAEVFLPFHRLAAPAGAADSAGHAGLGLAIAMRSAEALGCQIGVRSNPGRGSCFWLRVPHANSPTTGLTAPASLSSSSSAEDVLSGCRIAVLDDDPVLRNQTVTLFERWGCRVNASARAADFLQVNGPPQAPPDLAVVDYQLGPGEVDGISAVLELRSRLALSIPALVVSADSSVAASLAAANAGLKLVNKPVKPAQLRTILSDLRRNPSGS